MTNAIRDHLLHILTREIVSLRTLIALPYQRQAMVHC
jgi:hypothetical protein